MPDPKRAMLGFWGKTAALLGFLLVLGLYRNFGVPILRIWPLILIDMLLRIPGDWALKLLAPDIPEAWYEILRSLLQLALPLILWWIWNKNRKKPSYENLPTEDPVSAPPEEPMLVKTRRTRRRRLAAAGWIVFGLLIISSRIGRGGIIILSFITGVHPYPLQVVTDVSLEMSDRDMDVSEFYRGEEEIRLLPEEGGRTANAVAFQDKLLVGCRKKIPLLRPGRFRIGQLPPGMSSEEAKAVERRALDFLNAFSDLDWYYTADASLVLSRDGKRAIYKIALVSYDGALAASGTGYIVEFVRIDAGWLITNISHSGQWIS